MSKRPKKSPIVKGSTLDAVESFLTLMYYLKVKTVGEIQSITQVMLYIDRHKKAIPQPEHSIEEKKDNR